MNTKDFIRLGVPLGGASCFGLARGTLSGRAGSSGDFRCELFKLALQPAHLLQRPLGKDSELPWLCGKQLAAQHAEGFVHALQLFERLDQDGIGLVHSRTRNSPFLNSGASRTRLKNSTYVLYSELSRSATITSKPNLRSRSPRDTNEYSDIGRSHSKSCPGRSTATRSIS